jgi:hypothetical protein
LNEVALLAASQAQPQATVVVFDDARQCGEAPVMVEAALGMRKQVTNGGCSISMIRGTASLKVIDTDFARGM